MEQIIASFLSAIFNMIRLLIYDPVNLFLFSLLFLNTMGYILILTILVKIGHGSDNSKQATIETSKLDFPLVSFIIPAHNEEEVIERKLENTYNLNYPSNALEVIVVDDGSTDQTPSILQNLQTRFPKLKVVRQNRKGKSAAENVGLREAKGEITVISDADCPLNPDALRLMVEDFENPQVGGVTCSVQAGDKYVLTMNLNLSLYTRKLENKIDSVFGMSGPFAAFKKSIISQIDEGIYSSDTDIGVLVRRNGFKVVFDSRILSFVDQWVINRPKTVTRWLKRMKHLSFGSLFLFLRHKKVLFRKSYGFFGLLIAPRHLLLNVFAPVIFVVFSTNYILNLIENNLFPAFVSLALLLLLTTFILRRVASGFIVTRVLYLIFMYVLGYFAQFIYYIMFLLSPSQRRGIWKGV